MDADVSPIIIHSHTYVIQMHILICICMHAHTATLVHAHACAHTHMYCPVSTSLSSVKSVGRSWALPSLERKKLSFFLFVLAIIS